jgi:hypothetical protein
MVKINIDKAVVIKPELEYVFSIWAKNAGVAIQLVDSTDAVTIANDERSLFFLNDSFLQRNFRNLQPNPQGFIQNSRNTNDLIATAFFLINSIQEHNIPTRDSLGRFQYRDSFQFANKNVKINLVQQCFDGIARTLQVPVRNKESQFFLTHDIDLVHQAIVEDGFNVIRKGQFHLFFKLLFNVAMGRPDWLNIDKILKLESEYDCKSVFYWIVNKGKLNKKERNADYSFKSPRIQSLFSLVEKFGSENGIHKSISPETFREEFTKYGSVPEGNRYHYLKFSLPQAYHDIESAGLQLDASLGFAEDIGFRNNYGLPFNPYNLADRRPFKFVEVPLHVMDRTCFQYMKLTPQKAETEILNFLEKNRQNAVLSILWHNNFFTDYKFKGYLQLYKKLLAYIKENSFQTVSQKEIIQNYSII